jgi:hypothetical protein
MRTTQEGAMSELEQLREQNRLLIECLKACQTQCKDWNVIALKGRMMMINHIIEQALKLAESPNA